MARLRGYSTANTYTICALDRCVDGGGPRRPERYLWALTAAVAMPKGAYAIYDTILCKYLTGTKKRYGLLLVLGRERSVEGRRLFEKVLICMVLPVTKLFSAVVMVS